VVITVLNKCEFLCFGYTRETSNISLGRMEFVGMMLKDNGLLMYSNCYGWGYIQRFLVYDGGFY